MFDQVDDIERIMRHVPGRSVCVQAGGACGVWPERLSHLFDVVFTFEPDALNFRCLEANAPGAICAHAALGAVSGRATVRRHPSEATNCGAGYVEVGNDVPLLALDDIIERPIDLLLLDVEGAEYAVLSGAQRLIRESMPVVVIEEKPLPQGGDHLAARRLLETWGYRECDRIHRDVVFRCC